jgi:hypothetical protein
VRSEIESIKNENERLKTENKILKDKENKINAKERDLKYKEDNLKREVEKEFYESNIGETLKRYIDDCELWFADEGYIQKEKCNLCNKERKLIAEFPNGKTTKIDCECAKLIRMFTPCLTTEEIIKFSKKNSRYASDRVFYLTRSYSPSEESNYYNESHYNEFRIGHIVDHFNDETKELLKSLEYGQKLGFRVKEECQKYCDWLNKRIDNIN